MLWVLVLSCVLVAGEAAKLPSYINKCKRTDPDINECVVKNSNLAIRKIANGDKKLKIPNMKPFKLDEILIRPGPNFMLDLKKVEIFGLEEAVAVAANVQLDKDSIEFSVKIPEANLKSDYEINGRILVLPIEGKGKANIVLVNGTYNYKLILGYNEKNGVKYADIKSSALTFGTERIKYRLENLFNGNKALGEEMNRFLNENWRLVSMDLQEAVIEIIDSIISSIMKAVLRQVPFNEIFLEK